MNGWIKLHRKFADWGYYGNSQIVHLFIHFLINANFEDKDWNGIIIKRGQLVTGLKSIQEATGISIQSTRTILKKLESTKEIVVKSTNKYSIITICKYDDYQFENDDANKQLTNNQQTTNKQLTTPKEYKEIKKERNNNDILDFGDQEIIKPKICIETEKEKFEIFRKAYEGDKRGLEIEFENFRKKHKDWYEVNQILLESYKKQKSKRETNQRNGNFVPMWKHLQTYINQRDWETEITLLPPKQQFNNNQSPSSNGSDYVPSGFSMVKSQRK